MQKKGIEGKEEEAEKKPQPIKKIAKNESKNESKEEKEDDSATKIKIKKEPKKRGFLFYAIVSGLLIGLGMLLSYVTTVAVSATSGVQFCGSCHTMEPMAESYKNSVHGGFGSSGVVADCADCHLPHDSVIGHLIQKGKSGMWDLWVETMYDTSKLDWHDRRSDRRRYVYDSGCLHCHTNLLKATKLRSQAFVAHKAYFENKLKVKDGKKWTKIQCVDCHQYVGHYKLEEHLPSQKEDNFRFDEE